ncbi:lysis system i-spanin subunit Rz [Pseudomonas agarici]
MSAQVKLIAYLVLALALIGAGAAGAWQWQANAYGKKLASKDAAYQADLTRIATAGAAQARQAMEKQQVAEQAVAAIDAKASQEKSNDLAENDLLRRLYSGSQADNQQLHADIAAAQHRLRIAGTCTGGPGGGDLSKTASATGLGDAGTVELAPDAGQAVFDIRAGIVSDQAALKALQAYVTNVCLLGSGVR